MKLFYTKYSPYARLVRVAIYEKGLNDQIEPVLTTVRDPKSELLNHSPLGRVPALMTETGEIITESLIICRYLDHLAPSKPFLAPAHAPKELAKESIMLGFLDGTTTWVRALLRGESINESKIIPHELERAKRTLTDFEQHFENLRLDINFGHTALACGLLLINQCSMMEWTDDFPKVASWLTQYSLKLPGDLLD